MNELASSLFGWLLNKNAVQAEETARLERLLIEQFAPVKPRPAYVNDLGKRLSDRAQPIIVQGRSREEEIGFWQVLLLIAAGVVSGILLVLLGVRFIVSIFASRQARQEL